MPTSAALGLLALTGAACATHTIYGSQVHLALGKAQDELNVAWRSSSSASKNYVEYGATCDALTKRADGDSRKFTQDSSRTWYTHVATMEGLQPGAKYCYRVSAGNETYETTFRRQGAPYKHILYADLGATYAHALCDACTDSSERCDKAVCARAKNRSAGLISEVDTADLFFHGGDFGYDLGDWGGEIGDAFMMNIEQLAAHVPYMVSHGNHEVKHNNLPHYIERFRNIASNADVPLFHTKNGAATNTMYYSFDFGLVHYVIFASELWQKLDGMDRNVTRAKMITWLKADLAAANKRRDEFPWIVVTGHRAFYTSMTKAGVFPADVPMRKALEDVLFDNGVDIVLNGHVHTYERMYPVYDNKATHSTTDMKAPMYIVSGAAGCDEAAYPFRGQNPDWSAFRTNGYSYSRMTVYNATHIHWEQVETDPVAPARYGQVMDDAWFVQHNHGPFDRAAAPKGTPCPPGMCKTHDRYSDDLLARAGLPQGSGATAARLEAYAQEHGPAGYDALMGRLLEEVNKNATGAAYKWHMPK